MSKCLVLQTMSNKNLAKSKKIKEHWARPEKVNICFDVSFQSYYQKLDFGGETGH